MTDSEDHCGLEDEKGVSFLTINFACLLSAVTIYGHEQGLRDFWGWDIGFRI